MEVIYQEFMIEDIDCLPYGSKSSPYFHLLQLVHVQPHSNVLISVDQSIEKQTLIGAVFISALPALAVMFCGCSRSIQLFAWIAITGFSPDSHWLQFIVELFNF